MCVRELSFFLSVTRAHYTTACEAPARTIHAS